jgi:hypothetical protein
VVTPAARREAVAYLVKAYEMSQRRACSVTGTDRSTIRYRRRRSDDSELRERLRILAAERRRFGYRRLHVLLRREGHAINRKKTQRLYREEGLSVRRRRGRKRATGTRAPLITLAVPNARWSVDFVHDQFADGRRFRVFNVVDDVTKECLAAVVDTSVSGRRVARELTALVERRGKPGLIVSDRRGSANSPGDCWPEEGHRVHLERDARLVGADGRALALHRPRQAYAERHLRGVQRPHEGRVAQRDPVLRARPRPRGGGALGGGLQPHPPAFSPGLPSPGHLRRPTHRNGRSAPQP